MLDEIPLDPALRQHLLRSFCDTLEGCGTIRSSTLASYRAALDQTGSVEVIARAGPLGGGTTVEC